MERRRQRRARRLPPSWPKVAPRFLRATGLRSAARARVARSLARGRSPARWQASAGGTQNGERALGSGARALAPDRAGRGPCSRGPVHRGDRYFSVFWTSKALNIKIEKPFSSGFMRRSEVLQTLSAHRNELAAFGIKSLAIFGSVARDEARPDSDIDILVEFQGPATFNGYMDLKFFLEDLLQRPVDLVTRKSIRPRIKAQVDSEAQYVEGLSALS
ncbi:MAG: Nucleotidyltransferase domain protein [Methanosaeta sp. PtaU1.Bin060]|nr:MAG: Nucleotidyltransferase domain protein [Methanosaeta sp. PtaU1.Bin060]